MAKTNNKKRLDILLVERGFFKTRQKAQAAIMAGIVFIDNEKITKSGTQILADSEIKITDNICRYVSRGGLKLEKALKEFDIKVKDLVCIDAGASTGGFTDCLLQHGAAFVYAIDVGYGQFDWQLRNTDRVKLFERTNIRYVTSDILYENTDTGKASLCTIDLSFISVIKVLENILKLMDYNKQIIILIKPQFEAGRKQVSRSGVIRDKSIHVDVIERILNFCSTLNLTFSGLTFSPVKGPSGNIEYLCYLTSDGEKQSVDKNYILDVVSTAHKELNNDAG